MRQEPGLSHFTKKQMTISTLVILWFTGEQMLKTRVYKSN